MALPAAATGVVGTAGTAAGTTVAGTGVTGVTGAGRTGRTRASGVAGATTNRVVRGPVIDGATAVCVDGVPTVTWSSRDDSGITISHDGDHYGPYEPKGSAELPPGPCDSRTPQTYTVTTRGGSGPAATRVVPLTRPAPTTTTTPLPTPTPTTTDPPVLY
jgi:hypothetical protein